MSANITRHLKGRNWLGGAIVGLLALSGAFLRGADKPAELFPRLAYETSAYELAPEFQGAQRPWHTSELKRTILAHAAREKQRRQMDTYYYRVGFSMSFPLPLTRRPALSELPSPLPGRFYPWMTWLAWDLEERWRVLHEAWRRFGDREAGALLQRELAALAKWDHITEVDNSVGLATGHIAGCLALALADTSGWNPQLLLQARAAAGALLERDVWPWFERQWGNEITQPEQLANIPVIALGRSAQLARVVGSPRLAALDGKAREVFSTWCRLRMSEPRHTEGAAYDGYLMDSLTGWLASLPSRDELLREGSLAFRSLAEQWMDPTLPGRFDLQAPLGDVEPEMPFWVTPLLRLEGWYRWSDAAWLLPRFPLQRMPAAGLVAALGQKFPSPASVPTVEPHRLPNAVTLRTGWDRADLLAVVGLTCGPVGHLQADGGQIILGWQGRFWITDPGYQQYRPGEEREYTLGSQAHSAPVIGGKAISQRAARLQLLEKDTHGRKHARVDLAACYRGLPEGAVVERDVWLIQDGGLAVVARDTLSGVGKGTEVSTSWLGGDHFAWAFLEGWARLTDGEHALWVGTLPGKLEAAALTRHPGSRGPLTLTQTATLAEGQGTRWWVFYCEPKAGWAPPSLAVHEGALEIRAPGTASAAWSVE